MNPVSLVVITRNCKDNLSRLIEKHKDLVAEIIVVDQGSDDGTFELAKEKAAVAVKRSRKGYCEPDRAYAMSLAKCPWVLHLDDDEFLSDEAAKQLPDLINSNVDVFWFKRKNLVDGVDIKELLGDDCQPRLWKAGSLRWGDTMHQYPEGASNAKVCYLDTEIIHERTFLGMKKANQKRNAVAPPELVDRQNKFVAAVEEILQRQAA